jgi:hypothetical protein
MERFEERYKLFREYVEHEDALINNRLTWLITIHGFLYAAYALSVGKYVEVRERMVSSCASVGRGTAAFYDCLSERITYSSYADIIFLCLAICAIGVVICIVASVSIDGAKRAIDGIYNIFHSEFPVTKIKLRSSPYVEPCSFYAILVCDCDNNIQAVGARRALFCTADVEIDIADEKTVHDAITKKLGYKVAMYVPLAGGGDGRAVTHGFSASVFTPRIMLFGWIILGGYTYFAP